MSMQIKKNNEILKIYKYDQVISEWKGKYKKFIM